MRILYFYQYFTLPDGSWSTRAYEFSKRWVREGSKVTIVTTVFDRSGLPGEGLVTRKKVDGIDIVIINLNMSNKHGFVKRIIAFCAYAVIATWYALFSPTDVVLSSSGPLTVGMPGLAARYLRRKPFVFEVRDLWPDGAVQLGVLRNKLFIAMARLFEKTCYHAASRVVVLSDDMEKWIQDKYDIVNIDVVTNASDNELVKTAKALTNVPQWAVEKKIVIYAGALGLANNCGKLIDMARILKKNGDDDIVLAIIGDGKEKDSLERRVKEEELYNVHFLGLIPKPDVFNWLKMACCSLFVMKAVPVLATNSPNKLFDSLAVGIPIVQDTQGWIKELLDREQCGITVPADDVEKMAEAVIRFARDENLRERMSENAKRTALSSFDRDQLAGKMFRVLEESLDGKQGKRKDAVL